MVIHEALRTSIDRLDAEILLAHVLNKDRTWVIAHPDYRLPTADYRLFLTLVDRRKKHEPIAYITGEKEFYGLTFEVNRHTLIPRPETEMLVDFIVGAHGNAPGRKGVSPYAPTIIDIGTGSGAIAISVAKKFPHARILATDISPRALAVAKKNGKKHHVKNVTFLKADLLSANVLRFLTKGRGETRPCIIANLPYLPSSDKKKLSADIVHHEPPSALFAGKDGLGLIKKFLHQLAAEHIPFSSVLLEYDPSQTQKIRALAKKLFPRMAVTIHKDLTKKDRVLEISS